MADNLGERPPLIPLIPLSRGDLGSPAGAADGGGSGIRSGTAST